MAAANFDRYDLGDNVREDLADIIYNISPTQTPFLTGMGTTRAENTLHEWQTDELASVDPTNLRVDGADAGADTSAKSTRINNYVQISDKVIRISGRADVVNKAGRRTEMAYQLGKAAKALKRDMEAMLTANNASVAGNSTTASETGGLAAWLETNTARGATGADGGWAAGLVTAATNGTPRALTETLLRTVIRGCYDEGGEPETIMVSPLNKQNLSAYLFSSSARVATLYADQGKTSDAATALGTVDIYVSDFGALKIVPNRFQGHNGTVVSDRELFVLQMSMWMCIYLRNFRTHRLAKTGDAENRQMIVDYGLRSNNEKASGVIADIDASVPMVP